MLSSSSHNCGPQLLVAGLIFSIAMLAITISVSSNASRPRHFSSYDLKNQIYFPPASSSRSLSSSQSLSPTASPSPSHSPVSDAIPSPSSEPAPALSGCDAVLGKVRSSLQFSPMDEIKCLCERLQRRIDGARAHRGDAYSLPHRFSLETQRRDGFVFCLGIHSAGPIVRMHGHPTDGDQGRYSGGGRHGSLRGYFERVANYMRDNNLFPKDTANGKHVVGVFWTTTHDTAHIGVGMLEELMASSSPMLAWNPNKKQAPSLIMFPDFYFTDSGGYEGDKQKRSTQPVDTLINKVVWRGVSTGLDDISVGEREWADLPRAKLCLKARDYPHLLDAKLSGIVQVDGSASFHYTSSGIVGGGMSSSEMQRYRGQVDIDGNGNAWSGSFWKLLSGSITLKVDGEWVQWYHHKLKPWEHYVPVDDQMDNLRERVEWVLDNNNMAQKQEIATRSTEVVLAETLQSTIEETAKKLIPFFFERSEHPLTKMYSMD